MSMNAGWLFRIATGAVLGAALVACQGRPGPRATTRADAQAAPPQLAATPAPTTAPRGKQLTIVYSSNLLGEYEPCG